MEYFGEENRVHLSGRILTAPVFSHKTYGEAFYLMMLGAFRKSGCEDRIRLIVSERTWAADHLRKEILWTCTDRSEHTTGK